MSLTAASSSLIVIVDRLVRMPRRTGQRRRRGHEDDGCGGARSPGAEARQGCWRAVAPIWAVSRVSAVRASLRDCQFVSGSASRSRSGASERQQRAYDSTSEAAFGATREVGTPRWAWGAHRPRRQALWRWVWLSGLAPSDGDEVSVHRSVCRLERPSDRTDDTSARVVAPSGHGPYQRITARSRHALLLRVQRIQGGRWLRAWSRDWGRRDVRQARRGARGADGALRALEQL